MHKGRLRHIAISVGDAEETAQFYEEAFGLERISESRNAIRLSDGTINLTLLNAPTNPNAVDVHGEKHYGLHHIGFWIDDLDELGQKIQSIGGTLEMTEDDQALTEGAEHKYRDPDGIMFDLTTLGWAGSRKDA